MEAPTDQDAYKSGNTIGISNLHCALHTHMLTNAIVGFFISVSTCILEPVFFHLEGMCSDHK